MVNYKKARSIKIQIFETNFIQEIIEIKNT